MRSRTPRLLVVLLAVGFCLSFGVAGIASATEDPEDDEIIETQTVTSGAVQGEVHIELGYQIGDDTASLEIRIADPSFDVIEIDGFDEVPDEGHTYEWDERTTSPAVTVRGEVNRTNRQFDGYDFVDTGDWLLTDRVVPVDIGITAVDPDQIELHRYVRAGEEGVAGERMVYLGSYEDHTFEADGEQFRVVMSDDADPDWSLPEIGQRLTDSSELLDVGGKTEEITVFAVTDPLRQGGVATGTNADFWVHDATLTDSQTVLYHEYVHSRQSYDRTEAVEWTIEGGADYYALLLALKAGDIEYHTFHDWLEDGNDHGDVVLADPGTWQGTTANYELGALVLATLEREIRAESPGTFEDVFRAKNEYGEPVSDARFEEFVDEAAGREIGALFDSHVRSTPPTMTVPGPTVYDGPNRNADLSVAVSDPELDTGESEELTVEIQNTGTETSLAPALWVSGDEDIEVDLLGVDDSSVTETDRGWAFDHLESGGTHRVELLVTAEGSQDGQIGLSVADLSSKETTHYVTLDSRPALDATVTVPESAVEGDTVEAVVETSLDAESIEGYEFEITGPEISEQYTTNEPSLTVELGEPGSYTVSVTVTADDGRSVTASTDLTVEAAETDGTGETDDETADGESDDGDDDHSTETETTDDTSTGDGELGDEAGDGNEQEDETSPEDDFANGFGPAIAVGALLIASLVATYRTRD